MPRSIISRTDIFQRALAAKKEFYKELATYGEDYLGVDGASQVRSTGQAGRPGRPALPLPEGWAERDRTPAAARPTCQPSAPHAGPAAHSLTPAARAYARPAGPKDAAGHL